MGFHVSLIRIPNRKQKQRFVPVSFQMGDRLWPIVTDCDQTCFAKKTKKNLEWPISNGVTDCDRLWPSQMSHLVTPFGVTGTNPVSVSVWNPARNDSHAARRIKYLIIVRPEFFGLKIRMKNSIRIWDWVVLNDVILSNLVKKDSSLSWNGPQSIFQTFSSFG